MQLDDQVQRMAGDLGADFFGVANLALAQDFIFSHKLAAHLAGLGWIGKSCLLITPEAGPRVRFATVLTDAPLEPTGQSMQERCGE